ncbi:WecB/TagA/CpsF family glycosyltransferase [Candidatus Daviesbacteria bacterium]|nr:WecB/TagA/CpsF family glycosyltransferase [Candidatus Daviesbacteria bacterium]
MRKRNTWGIGEFMKVDVLGIKIDDVSLNEALTIVEHWIWNPGKHYIVTPNPEFIVAAQKDLVFKRILNNADLAVPDGVGLKLTGDIVMTTPGIDVMEGLVKMAEEKGFTTGFLGGRGKIAEKTAECLKRKYPKLKVSFASEVGIFNDDGDMIYDLRFKNREKIINPKSYILNLPQTGILFVALGPPKQEKWIAKNLPKIPVKVAMGVGGAFDIISGKVPRAPIWIQHLGFEWLFRLCLQPWRIKRQLALIQYLYLLLRAQLKG